MCIVCLHYKKLNRYITIASYVDCLQNPVAGKKGDEEFEKKKRKEKELLL